MFDHQSLSFRDKVQDSEVVVGMDMRNEDDLSLKQFLLERLFWEMINHLLKSALSAVQQNIQLFVYG